MLDGGILFGYNAACTYKKLEEDPKIWIRTVKNNMEKYKYFHIMTDDVQIETKKSLCS